VQELRLGRTSTLTRKFLLGIVLSAFIIFPPFVYFGTDRARETIADSFEDNTRLMAQLLDVQFQVAGDLKDETRLWNTLQKTMWLNPDVVRIDIAELRGDQLFTRLSTAQGRAGVRTHEQNLRSIDQDAILSEIVYVDGQRFSRVTTPIHVGREIAGSIELWVTLERVEISQDEVAGSILLAAFVFLIVYLLVTVFVLQVSVIAPIRHLVGFVSNFQTSFKAGKAAAGGNDEIGLLSESLTRMAKAIEVRDDVLTDRQRALTKALQETEEANAAKARLMATASHELRTPLNAIIGFSEILLGASTIELSEEKRRDYAETIRGSGQRMLSLVDDLLQISADQDSARKRHVARIDLVALLKACLSEVRLAAGADGLVLETALAADRLEIDTDEKAVKQIFVNLLSNAVKYTNEGSVRIEGGASGSGVRLSVVDTGIGIPANKLARVTEPFYRAHLSSDIAGSGTGLGLAIVQQNIDWLGGRLILESEVGVGTSVTVELPSKPPQAGSPEGEA